MSITVCQCVLPVSYVFTRLFCLCWHVCLSCIRGCVSLTYPCIFWSCVWSFSVCVFAQASVSTYVSVHVCLVCVGACVCLVCMSFYMCCLSLCVVANPLWGLVPL